MTDEPTPAWIRVRAKEGPGHEFDVAGRAFDPDMHVRVNKTKQYPDLHGDVPARTTVYRTTKAGQPATTTHEES